MGTFTVRIEVGDPAARRFVQVEALVDTGATHTVLSRGMLLTLGVEPVEQVAFQLADERVVEYQVGEARIRLDGRERTTVVVFGPEGATALLGATTLELFNMAVDPVRRRLVSVPGLLKEVGRL
ncbi:MAG: clan AA aspartic protease [Chloroflexi bacterium]|nr:clan AA aspartic protease [Chloroflexota bacterium]